MELWVRSQDKEDLIKVDNIGLAYKGKYNFIDNDVVDDKFYICQFTNEFHTKLGSYATKERALEVLNEIHQRLLNLQFLKVAGANYIPIKTGANYIPIKTGANYIPIKTGANYIPIKMRREGIDVVYIMPKE